MPHAIDLSLAHPIIRPRLPCIRLIDMRSPPTRFLGVVAIESFASRAGRVKFKRVRPVVYWEHFMSEQVVFLQERTHLNFVAPGCGSGSRWTKWCKCNIACQRWRRWSSTCGCPLKSIEKDAFFFYTNYESKKARSWSKAVRLRLFSTGSLCIDRCVSEEASKKKRALWRAYYESRHLQSRLGAWASAQSQPLASRQDLMDQVGSRKICRCASRPPHWVDFEKTRRNGILGGWNYRLHDRFAGLAPSGTGGPLHV